MMTLDEAIKHCYEVIETEESRERREEYEHYVD